MSMPIWHRLYVHCKMEERSWLVEIFLVKVLLTDESSGSLLLSINHLRNGNKEIDMSSISR
ncbi:hypothetical protein SCA6_009528 [Theobroma cacao]